MSTYEEWAQTHKSDINGIGHGSDHHWHYEGTPSNASIYKCAKCFWTFAHYYNHTPDIFKAIQASGVHDKCPRQPMWPIRLEYASAEEKEFYANERAKIGLK